MKALAINLLVVLGPTACGKTRLGVGLARSFGGEIISADSRQVYRGLDIGAGKDLAEYSAGGPAVRHHLIDIVGLEEEFSVFDFQRRFVAAFEDVRGRGALPILVGGSGLYLESVLKRYRLVKAPEDAVLRAGLAALSFEELKQRLGAEKDRLHNVSDFGSRERLIRAIEIAVWTKAHPPEPLPEFTPFIVGVRFPRQELKARIQWRLQERLASGLIEEVRGLLGQGVPEVRLEALGLEYRFVCRFLRGEIASEQDLSGALGQSIYLFAKRQEAWFNRFERSGLIIHWLDGPSLDSAIALVRDRAGLVPAGGVP